MKVTLIHGRFRNSWESQALGLIGAYIKEHRPEVQLDFFHGTLDDDDTIVNGASNSDIVAFSSTSPSFAFVQTIATRLKAIRQKTHVVVGGYHPSAVKDRCLIDVVDQVVVGEGEDAMVRIIDGDRSAVVYGRPMAFHDLPWCDRDLIKNERHIDVAYRDTGRRITSFQSHRGCPYRCRFCADGKRKTMHSGIPVGVRHRNVYDLAAEIAAVTEKYSLDLVKFCDPTWNAKPGWVHQFCGAKRAMCSAVPFFANIHARCCTADMFEDMANAGCTDIGIGVESGSERVLESMGKGITKDDVRCAVRWAKAAGIKVRGYFILGMPCEGNRELEETEAFADELDLDEYGFTILCPYPGTDFYDATLSRVDWTDVDEYSNEFWRTNTLTNVELRAWQKRLADRFASTLTFRMQKM